MSFLLLGARGCGKTWLLEEQFRQNSLLWINLLDNREFLKYQRRPQLLRGEIKEVLKQQTRDKEWIIIDEIQRVPELLNEVHLILEDQEFRGRIKFGLSGSSARKLKRGGANLLAGRALLNNLYPLSAQEVGQEFDLGDSLSWGLLPAVVAQSNKQVRTEQLEAYVAVYLREEIREEQIVRNLDPFSRFLEVAAQSSGSIVNYSKIGRDCNVDSRAIARYFQILEETLLGAFIPPYHRSVRKQQGKSPKFYFFDAGVMRTLEGSIAAPVTESSYGFGRLFEHFVIWEIIKLNDYSRKRFKLSYLITREGAEIDLIVERRGMPDVLIEIKSAVSPQVEDARHLLQLKKEFPNSEAWVISRIPVQREEKGVRFMKWETALVELFA